jgi:hypothetical protein
MADALAKTRTDERNAGPWLAIGIFLLLTISLTGVFWALIIATQTANATYVYGAMWMWGSARCSPARSCADRLARWGLAVGPGVTCYSAISFRSHTAWSRRSERGLSDSEASRT